MLPSAGSGRGKAIPSSCISKEHGGDQPQEPVAVGGAGLGVLVPLGADPDRGLGLDQLLQHRSATLRTSSSPSAERSDSDRRSKPGRPPRTSCVELFPSPWRVARWLPHAQGAETVTGCTPRASARAHPHGDRLHHRAGPRLRACRCARSEPADRQRDRGVREDGTARPRSPVAPASPYVGPLETLAGPPPGHWPAPRSDRRPPTGSPHAGLARQRSALRHRDTSSLRHSAALDSRHK